MHSNHRLASAILPFLGLAALVTISAASRSASLQDKGQGRPAATQISRETHVHFDEAWKEIDRLIDEQKFQQALEHTSSLRQQAKEKQDQRNWGRALTREAQLQTGLHGYETAVRFLRQESWPERSFDRVALGLFYAQSLQNYYRAYSWEIGQRERVESADELDLKAWTSEQIYAEAQRAYLEIWQLRDLWGNEPLGELAERIDQNDYPARIRGTLRDSITYLWVELLADSSLWSPMHSNRIYRLPLERLATSDAEALGDVDLGDPNAHPLLKIAAILADLEDWHVRSERQEAAFEARRERLLRLRASFTQESDQELLRDVLKSRLDDLGRHLPWWSMGMSTLAEMTRDSSDHGSKADAHEIASEGERAHPDSIGGLRNRHIRVSIEAPSFEVSAMNTDGPNRRSILVRHKNLERIHFRAYRLDLKRLIARAQDANVLPNWREVPRFLDSRTPDARWQVNLPATPDYRNHQTFVTPPMDESGLYLVVASERSDFAENQNRRIAVNLIVSDLVLISRNEGTRLEVTARSGATGQPLADSLIHLYRFDWQKGHRLERTLITAKDGTVELEVPSNRGRFFLVGEHGGDVALDLTHIYPTSHSQPQVKTSSLIYTDRSVYRPGQTLHWKVVAYRGGGQNSRFRTLPSSDLEVELVDANHEVVVSQKVETNEFGSVSGEWKIPSGRLLGGWYVRSSLGGQAPVRVEEYKRPTFEVSITDPATEMRLNRPATLEGEVRYYFGLPVVTGDVEWQVVREPLYPRWWFYFGYPTSSPETIAAGWSELGEEGRFEVTFVPEADERQQGMSYRYRLRVDVTDEGGETRSASRSVRLGFVAVEANISIDQEFFREEDEVVISVRRTSLDGIGRSGEGRWRLLRLAQPVKALLPADQPLPERPDESDAYRTEGDLLRPRWNPSFSTEAVLRSWKDGEELAGDRLSHDERGQAKIHLDHLEAGAYRLRYETRDGYDGRFETTLDFVVAAEGRTELQLPAVLLVQERTVSVGGTARILVHSGLADQPLVLDTFRHGRRIRRRLLDSAQGLQIIEIPIGADLRGGFGFTLSALRDHQLMQLTGQVYVPWEDKKLEVDFETFRDLIRPGAVERWRVKVRSADGGDLEQGAAELLAYMYDRSLDIFAPHQTPSPLHLYPNLSATRMARANLGVARQAWNSESDWYDVPIYPSLTPDRLHRLEQYGIGGPGGRRYGRHAMKSMSAGVYPESVQALAAPPSASMGDEVMFESIAEGEIREELDSPASGHREAGEASEEEDPVRTNFSETAFWEPHLLIDEDGQVTFEFEVPDSVTEWNVWVHALTRDLRGGSIERQTRSVKDLLVRPYVPRFFREGDEARLEVVINNAGEVDLSGELDFDIFDPETEESLLGEFGLSPQAATNLPFTVASGKGTTLSFAVKVPARVGQVAFKAIGRAGDLADGEQRSLPVLPGRMHLAQSRFVTLRDEDRRQIHFEDLARAAEDPTLLNEQLVVTLDAQLFYGVLGALPYLVDFPYECVEQTLNRFVSSGIVSSVFDRYPAVARMAEQLAERDSRFEKWNEDDANRKMALVETPWLRQSRGQSGFDEDLIKILDPEVAAAHRKSALAQLEKIQTSLGAFPWWPGGPPSPYMTLYMLSGFSRALEFEVELPRPMVTQAWSYMHRHYVDKIVGDLMAKDCCWEMVTFLNYVLSSYPDESWTGGVFSDEDRRKMLDFSLRHWKEHSPLSKAQLALTLARSDRPEDADLVFDSVMDSAKTTRDGGTFWAPEDRAWLWYNDTIETHAMALRTLGELDPDDSRRHGLVQWLFLNKKLGHWKSTRATAEVIYSLVHYLDNEGQLGVREAARVELGPITRDFVFEPDEFTGRNNQIIVEGDDVDPNTMATIEISKETPGLLFASATWHFSTEKLPEEARGDLFQVERTYFRRLHDGREWTLEPMAEGDGVKTGDQIEVHLSIRARHAAEYVHLRDPRGAGFEPESVASRYRWDLGISWYEEIRDSGTNFFFEWLPAGEYTLKYRVRANMKGRFRVGPATLQSMYAPEFTAYSTGSILAVEK